MKTPLSSDWCNGGFPLLALTNSGRRQRRSCGSAVRAEIKFKLVIPMNDDGIDRMS
jgi:hypothetical protein